MNRFTARFFYLITAFSALALICTSPSDQSGNSSQLGNGKTAAMLCNADGSPAAGAKVVFVPVSHTPGTGLAKLTAATICSTTTDKSGMYSFASVPGGTYNIFGTSDTGRSYQDSVPVAAGVAEVEPDTLRRPGTVRGSVKLTNGLDYKTVYLLIPGSMVFCTVDSTGYFTLSGMAEGAYPVRFYTHLDDWEPKDTALTVVTGIDTTLPDPIELRYKRVPIPQGFVVRYDTLRGVAVLKWDALDTSLIDGINIYRAAQGENFVLVTDALLPETTTTYLAGLGDVRNSENHWFEFRVVAHNRAGEESRMVDVVADTAFWVDTWLAETIIERPSYTFIWYSGRNRVPWVGDSVDAGETKTLFLSYSNPTRQIRRIQWYIGEFDTFKINANPYYVEEEQLRRTLIREKADSLSSGSDTLMHQWDTPGLFIINFRIFDSSGDEKNDYFLIRVDLAAPVAKRMSIQR